MAAPRKCNTTDDEFRQAVAESLSVRQVLNKIGLVPAGGNYKTIQTRIARLGLDTSHFTGAAWNQGARYKAFGCFPDLQELLVTGSTCQSFKLKNRLLKAGLLAAKCSECQLEQWRKQPIPLELDHINGINNDNRIENLRLLCPNCHALTNTYRGKNQKRSKLTA